MNRPTHDDCTAKTVREDGSDFVLTTWHPQWGGYASPCEVRFGKASGDGAGEGIGCFDVTNWHDGEFPTDDEECVTRRHYCSAEQVVDFGLDIIDAQLGRQVSMTDKDKLVGVDSKWIDETIARLTALRERNTR